MDILAASLTNRNDHLVLGTQTTTQGINTVLVQQYTDDQSNKSPDGSPIGPLYNASQLTRAPNANSSTWVGPNGPMGAYIQYNLTNQTTTTTVVQSTAPAQILAGGNLTVTGGAAGSLLNANSLIVAGGALTIIGDTLDNQSAQGSQTVTQSGSYGFEKYVNCCSDWLGFGGYNGWYGVAGGAYNPPSTTTSVDLATATATGHGSLTGLGLPSPLIPTGGALGLSSSTGVSTTPPALSLPTSPLFVVQSAPAAPYLVETDPAFTNQQNFLSSNYYLQQLSINPAQWQQRYGDGFVEQQLLRQQILTLTGHLRLTGYANTQAEYAGLMQAGVAFAKAYGIAPGVSLSAQQMALVTTDMVMLTTDTVRLPDGSTEKVLVPQVYLAHPQGQDLTQGGALIAGGTVQITTAQDVVNGGTIGGTSVQVSAGTDLTNTGTIAGYQVGLSAGQDLQDLSGLIAGSTSTSLSAGRDLLLATQTTAATSATGSTTSLDHVATLQGGTITLQAARDLIARGATIASTGDLTAVAGRNLSLGATTTPYQFASGGPLMVARNNVLQVTSQTQHGTTVSAGGNVALVAQGGDLTINASAVTAGGNAALLGQNVTIASGVNNRTSTTQLVGNGGYGDNTRTTQSAAGADVRAGQALSIQAVGNGQAGTGDLTLIGAQVTAQTGSANLQAAHDLNVNTLALNDSTTYQSRSETSGFFGASTDSAQASTTSTAQGASAVTGPSVAMTAGNDLTVTGSQVTGTGTTPSTGQVAMTAGGTMTIQAAALSATANSTSHHDGGVFGNKSHDTSQLSQTTAQASRITGRALTLQSGGDMTFQAAQFTGTSLMAQAGTLNGQVVNPAAQLHINAAINDLSHSSSHSGNTLFTQSKAGQGTIQQTLQYTTIVVPGASQGNGPVQLVAPGGITVGASNLPTVATGNTPDGSSTPTLTVNLRQQAQELASQPGLGYLAPLTARSDVSWQQVQLASQQWNYHEAGLSGAGAAIIAIAVAVCTAGAGAALVGVAATSASGAMASAAFTSLVTQASISLADNGGNIGETLKALGSRSSVRALATSVVTAGLTTVSLEGGQSLNQMAGLSNLGNTGRSLATGTVSSTTVEGIAGRAVVNAGVSTALQGTSFRQGLVDGAVADVSAIGANAIGSTWGGTGTDPNALFQTVAHGALGCAEAGLTGGNCGAGAAGAATESILGNLVTLPATAQGTVSRTDATVYATSAAILGAVAGQATDGHALSGANTAINSAVNNRLLHPDEQKTLSQLQQGQSPQEQFRLAAAACALTRCAASLPANNPYKAALQALQTAGQNYPTEQALLTKNGLFGYSSLNAVSDWVSRNPLVVRGLGAVQGVGGTIGAVAGAGIMTAGCETGVACVGGFALAASSADYAQAGYRQMLTGTYTPTLGQQVLTDLGLSPTTAAWTYAGLSFGAGVGVAVSAVSAGGGILARTGAAETGVGGIGAGADGAADAVNGLNLNKLLASQEQLSQLMTGNGIPIAGDGGNALLRDAPRLVSEYGGQSSDWSKVTSSSYRAADGSQFETHAYRNAVTGQVVEPKSIPLK